MISPRIAKDKSHNCKTKHPRMQGSSSSLKVAGIKGKRAQSAATSIKQQAAHKATESRADTTSLHTKHVHTSFL